MSANQIERLALIAAMVEKAPGRGRTALMKYCYFLQAIRGVPLGYSFTLYAYGPFESDVLADLGSCEAMGAIVETVVEYPRSYGYRITPGAALDEVKDLAPVFVARYEPDVAWVVEAFGTLTAAELELVSTVIYADRSLRQATKEELVQVVHGVKPHFTLERIRGYVERLQSKGLLGSLVIERKA
jgi:uncharacterized protein